MPDQVPNQSSRSTPSLPPRPLCRPGSSRFGTLCFWTVLLLFLAGIGFLGLLAYTRNSGQAQPYSEAGQIHFELLLGGIAVATIIGVIATRFKRLH